MTDQDVASNGSRRRQWRVSAILLVASLAGATGISACASTIEGPATYAGGGATTTSAEGSDTFSVPPPSDPSVSTTPPEVTTESPEEVLTYQCKVVTGYALEFLPTWQKVVAVGNGATTEQRHSVAVALIAAASKVDAYRSQIKDKTLLSLAEKIVAEEKKLAELVDSGSAAGLDALQAIITQADDYCG